MDVNERSERATLFRFRFSNLLGSFHCVAYLRASAGQDGAVEIAVNTSSGAATTCHMDWCRSSMRLYSRPTTITSVAKTVFARHAPSHEGWLGHYPGPGQEPERVGVEWM